MKPHPTKSKPRIAPYLAPQPPAPRDAEWAARYLREHFSEEVRLYLVSVRSTAPSWDSHEQLVNALLLKFARHAPADSASAQLAAAQAEVGRLTKERDERWTELDCSYVNMVQKLSSLVRSIIVSYERGASQDVWPKVEEMRDWMELKHPYVADLKRLVDDHETRTATSPPSARAGRTAAELLTTHQMACRVGLERDELRAKQGEAP